VVVQATLAAVVVQAAVAVPVVPVVRPQTERLAILQQLAAVALTVTVTVFPEAYLLLPPQLIAPLILLGNHLTTKNYSSGRLPLGPIHRFSPRSVLPSMQSPQLF
jgi:hypothetical protein